MIHDPRAERALDRTAGLAVVLAATVGAGALVARGDGVAVLALLGVVVYAAFFLSNPTVALLALLATRPVVEGFVFVSAGGVRVGQLWGAGVLVALVVYLIASRRRGPIRIPLPVAALVVLYAVMALRGTTHVAFQFGPKLVLWLLVIIAVERVAATRAGQMMAFQAGYALAAGTAVLIGILAALNKFGAAYYGGEFGSTGSYQDPQPLAFLALFSISFPLIALLNKWRPALSLALAGTLAIEITISYVRTALVALALVALIYVFVGVRRRRVTAFAVAAVLAATTYSVQNELGSRFSDVSLVTSGNASGAGSNRLAIWQAIWDWSSASFPRMLWGGGAGTSHALSQAAIGHYVDAHNDVLEYFATGGLVLVAAYLAVVVWMIRALVRVHRDRRQSSRARAVAALALGMMCAFLSVSLFGSISFYAALIPFAILVGLMRGIASTPGETCFDPAAPVHVVARPPMLGRPVRA